MTDIYDQHSAAFNNVAAYVIMRGGYCCAKIAIKFPRDGAGRLYAYVHWHGATMVRGYAGGGGYDKRSAAIANAAAKLAPAIKAGDGLSPEWFPAFVTAIGKDDGNTWHNNLLAAGFEVYQAV